MVTDETDGVMVRQMRFGMDGLEGTEFVLIIFAIAVQ
jgi:hypothetical protein